MVMLWRYAAGLRVATPTEMQDNVNAYVMRIRVQRCRCYADGRV